MNLSYGPILCIGGKNKGRIGYYDGDDYENDDDLDEQAVVYWGNPLVCTEYTFVPFKYCTNDFTMHDIIKRIEYLYSCVARKPENKSNAIFLQELIFAENLMYEKHIRARFNNRKGLKLFISYSTKDKEYANAIYADLCDIGHDPWKDDFDIYAGQNIPKEIEDASEASDYLLVLLSKNSVESGWVNAEWISLFWDEISEQKIKVIPILLEDCKIPRFLKIKKYVDFREEYDIGINELVRALK